MTDFRTLPAKRPSLSPANLNKALAARMAIVFQTWADSEYAETPVEDSFPLEELGAIFETILNRGSTDEFQLALAIGAHYQIAGHVDVDLVQSLFQLRYQHNQMLSDMDCEWVMAQGLRPAAIEGDTVLYAGTPERASGKAPVVHVDRLRYRVLVQPVSSMGRREEPFYVNYELVTKVVKPVPLPMLPNTLA